MTTVKVKLTGGQDVVMRLKCMADLVENSLILIERSIGRCFKYIVRNIKFQLKWMLMSTWFCLGATLFLYGGVDNFYCIHSFAWKSDEM